MCHFCHNWGTFILLTWMPTYYNKVGARVRESLYQCVCVCVSLHESMCVSLSEWTNVPQCDRCKDKGVCGVEAEVAGAQAGRVPPIADALPAPAMS